MNIILILIGSAILVGGIVFGVYKITVEESGGARIITIGAIVGLALLTFGNSFKIIPTGYTGVQTVFGQISERTMPQGFNWKAPFVSDIKLVNNKIQSTNVEGQIWGECNDKTPVYASDITISYQINPEKSAWLYANVANGTNNLVSVDIVQTAVKNAMVEFAYDEVTVRSNIEPESLRQINNRLTEKYGEGTVTVMQVIIGQMDFEEAYNQAIQQRSIAVQKRETQRIENETAAEKAEADKHIATTKAKADAEKIRIATEAEAEKIRILAEAEADANRLISESLTDNILRAKFYDSWDGVLPQVMGTDTVITSIEG